MDVKTIKKNMNNFVTCTAYRNDKPVTFWAKCVRKDGTHYWKTVEWGELTGPELESEDLASVLEVLEGTGVRLDFDNHSAC